MPDHPTDRLVAPAGPLRTLGRAVLALAIAVASLGAASVLAPDRAALAQAPRDPGAEQFVQTQAQRVISILGDTRRSRPDRIRDFRLVVNEIADIPRITRFVLGKYARTATPAQMQAFSAVFHEYAQNVYEHRLGDFHGDRVTVTGSLVRKPGDVVVNTTVFGPGGGEPAQVSWRVLGSGASWKVVDLENAGVWLAITQQQDFVSTIDNHGGRIDALISQLEKLTRQQATGADAR
jgi:phospholipid transport system substrate-binding protein